MVSEANRIIRVFVSDAVPPRNAEFTASYSCFCEADLSDTNARSNQAILAMAGRDAGPHQPVATPRANARRSPCLLA